MEPRTIAHGFLDFVNHAVTPFHAVAVAKRLLSGANFTELHEHETWTLSPGSKYFFTRNETSIYAFVIGREFSPLEGGFRCIGTHTDSPCPKLAPNSRQDSNGFLKLNVQLYGGGLWHSWFDRDLTVAGRILVRENERLESRLVHVKRPIINLPQLAIHLSSTRDKFEYDKENHVKPLLSTLLLEREKYPNGAKRHSQGLLELISQEINVPVSQIEDLELNVIDSNPSQITGLYEEFISSPRIDNLASTFCALTSISETDNNGKDIKLFAAFDHEECGSLSMQGADSSHADQTLRRILAVLPGDTAPDAVEAFYRRSFILSADMAHAQHPNYPEKHQSSHAPQMHQGVVIKNNANQRYASEAIGSTLLRTLGSRNNIKMQEFMVKNDSPCGTTIGPILAGQTGIRTADIGAPMLAMHSCREMMGTDDAYHYANFMKVFYSDSHDFAEGAALR